MSDLVLDRAPLGMPWVTVDPFLFCVYHKDAYPKANERFGPAVSLAGRNLGMDFEVKDGFRMYHGQVVPGFPQHPHRGFETVTVVRRGLVDHADSLGAAARYGRGDTQWMTAGKGIVHSEMFPLLERDADNPLELFQIWLNLPPEDKMAEPHFAMLWAEETPRLEFAGDAGATATVTVVAGAFPGPDGADVVPPAPPPRSWASRADADVAIWTVELDAGAALTLPPARHEKSLRILYFFDGKALGVGDGVESTHGALVVRGDLPVLLRAPDGAAQVLVLQGRPIGAPVANHGPFVMNTRQELQQAFADYQKTRFGGWPWETDDPVHGDDGGRFARLPSGETLRPKAAAE